jgi:hypothetical protein
MRLSCCRNVGRFAVLVVACLVLPRMVEAQVNAGNPAPKAEPAVNGDAYTLLTYNVADLLLNVPDYPYLEANKPPMGRVLGGQDMGGMGMGGMGMGGGIAGGAAGPGTVAASNPTRITIDDLVQMIVRLVAPGTWESGRGEVVPLGTSLVVRQTAEAHQEIQKLLGQLRAESGSRKTVAIDARWLLLDSNDLERLAPPASDGSPTIDRKMLAEYTRRPSSLRGLTNCHTGQLVYLVSGTRKNVVTSFIPVVGRVDLPGDRDRQLASLEGGGHIFLTGGSGNNDDGQTRNAFERTSSVGYQPQIEKPNFGVLLEIRPTLLPHERTATVDLRSTLTVPGRESPDDREGTRRDPLVPTVDRLAIETQELATTLTVPLGRPVLVGGMSYLGPSASAPLGNEAKADAMQAKETPQLYLILELR